MDIEKMREEFEAWQAKETPGADLQHCGALIGSGPARESYRNMYVAERWIGWQASRESLVIDLSDLSQCFSPHDCGDWAMWLDDVRILAQAAGLKVRL